jgi:hypothetical protein
MQCTLYRRCSRCQPRIEDLDRRAKADQISPQCCSTLVRSVIAEWGLRCEYPWWGAFSWRLFTRHLLKSF